MPRDFSSILAALARAMAAHADLGAIIVRVAELTRDVIPFEHLHLLRLDTPEEVVRYSVHGEAEAEVVATRVAARDLDATAVSVDVTETKAFILCPLRSGARVNGALWFTSSAADAFSAGHQQMADAIADLLGLAVHAETLRSTETLRMERLDTLDKLLHTVAETLDVRTVFTQVSELVQTALPHDLLALVEWSDEGRAFRLYAISQETPADPDLWQEFPIPEHERAELGRDWYIVRDAATEIEPGSTRDRLFRALGVQSALRVAMPLAGGIFGALLFLSRQPETFGEDQVPFARRVSDHVALALSHERLAEAARRDAEVREQAAQLEARVAMLTRELEQRGARFRVIGESRRWKEVLAQATRVAKTETTVLLTGESGTGKEVVARFIHHGSPRAKGPFIAINCAALPDELLESELFGHERGAFTGAVASKPGRIEQATGGVLFLDEVGEMTQSVQAKLLRVLQEREFQRLGGTRVLKADIRVIAATNRDLLKAMERGTFREDLYYRLRVFEIALPLLGERPDDILPLAEAFLEEIGGTIARPAAGLTRDARELLRAYAWPGNVRELRNAIERAVILADGGMVTGEHLPISLAPREPRPTLDVAFSGALPPGGVSLDAIERSLVQKALAQARHNKTRAARLLGLTRAQLYTRIERYGLADEHES